MGTRAQRELPRAMGESERLVQIALGIAHPTETLQAHAPCDQDGAHDASVAAVARQRQPFVVSGERVRRLSAEEVRDADATEESARAPVVAHVTRLRNGAIPECGRALLVPDPS